MKNIRNLLIVYTAGAVIYSTIEILYRGYTHWTMAVTGGIALMLIYLAETKNHSKNYALRLLGSAGIITALEFAVGIIVNKIFKLGVWDYSGRPFNILGQVCPLFSLFWILLSIPTIRICYYFRRIFKQT